jgi:phage head maturation protease
VAKKKKEPALYETDVSFDDNNIRLNMPVFKVDEQRRTVHGFATLDNLDSQDDIVTQEASKSAFSRFRGNIREQHDPTKAVGKVVDFKEQTLYDADSDKEYNGVFVSAYVSKGAQDTWEKVLDGTLTGFSIGGAIEKTESAYDENLDKSVRIVHDYNLVELSLVDSPANHLANVVSIEKSKDGEVEVSTPLVKGDIENVFWCDADNLVVVKSTEEEHCAICNCGMDNVGFVEVDDLDKKTTIKSALETFKKNLTAKEASNMAEQENVEKAYGPPTTKEEPAAEPVAEEPQEVAEEVVVVEEEVAEEVPEAVEEAVVVEEEESKEESIDELLVTTKNEWAKAKEDIASLQKDLTSSLASLADTVKALNDKIDGVASTVSGVEKQVQSTNDSLGKRMNAVEDTTAFRKSGDLGEVAQVNEAPKQESVWGGRFLNTADL